MNKMLDGLCKEWINWKESADQSENGWQSDFEKWGALISAAESTMLSKTMDSKDLNNLELCWQISEEYESLLEFAKSNLEKCAELLDYLAKSKIPEVRWQVYEAIANSAVHGETVLVKGLEDPNPYCRRRAILSLARIRPDMIATIKLRFSTDADNYVRKAVESLNH